MNKRKKKSGKPKLDKITVLSKSENFMMLTNARSVAKWKEDPKGSGCLVFDRIVKL